MVSSFLKILFIPCSMPDVSSPGIKPVPPAVEAGCLPAVAGSPGKAVRFLPKSPVHRWVREQIIGVERALD